MALPPEIARRHDGGLMLHGWCGCYIEGRPVQLIVLWQPRELLMLSFHGTAEHSIVLNPAQQQALMAVLRSRPPTPAMINKKECNR